MLSSYAITDPTSALMLAGLEVDELGSVRNRRDLRRRQRRFQRHARLRKLLA